MASNFIQPGKTITCTAPVGGVVAGGGYLIGSIFVIAQNTAAAGEAFEGLTEGVFDIGKTNGLAPAAGAKASFDTATGLLVAPGAGKVPVGAYTQAAAGGDATGRVRLDGISTAAA